MWLFYTMMSGSKQDRELLELAIGLAGRWIIAGSKFCNLNDVLILHTFEEIWLIFHRAKNLWKF